MNILVTIPVKDHQKEQFIDAAKDHAITFERKPSDEQIEQADIILGNIPASRLPLAKNLKWIQLNSAGSDAYIAPGLLKEGALLTNATGSYGLTISEYMIGTLLMLMNHFHQYYLNQKEHNWKPLDDVRSIAGSTIVSVGMGDIGYSFISKCHDLGAYTIGVKRRESEKPDKVDELYLIEDLDTILPRADVVALSLPNTPATVNLFDKEKFAKMKPDAILINVGRGTSVKTDDLIEALETGQIGGAILDVTEPEPLNADSPLWDMDNVLITPHISGGYSLPQTLQAIVDLCCRNMDAFFKGEELENLVDMETGYKK